MALLGFVPVSSAAPSPVKPIDTVAVSSFRACKVQFELAKKLQDSVQRNKRLEEARSSCESAERIQHAVEHLVWLGNIHQALGRTAEAREYWGRVVVETSDASPPNEKAWRDEALRQLAPFFAQPPAPTVVRPEAAVDLGRLSNQALPDDLARPAMETCANAVANNGKLLASRIEVELHVSEHGQLTRVSVTMLPAHLGRDEEPLSPAFLSCIERDLHRIEVPRESGARPVIMTGRFMVVVGDVSGNPRQPTWVSGRMRESTR